MDQKLISVRKIQSSTGSDKICEISKSSDYILYNGWVKEWRTNVSLKICAVVHSSMIQERNDQDFTKDMLV